MVEIKENILFSVVPLKEMEPTWYGLKWGTDVWERAYEMFPSSLEHVPFRMGNTDAITVGIKEFNTFPNVFKGLLGRNGTHNLQILIRGTDHWERGNIMFPKARNGEGPSLGGEGSVQRDEEGVRHSQQGPPSSFVLLLSLFLLLPRAGRLASGLEGTYAVGPESSSWSWSRCCKAPSSELRSAKELAWTASRATHGRDIWPGTPWNRRESLDRSPQIVT